MVVPLGLKMHWPVLEKRLLAMVDDGLFVGALVGLVLMSEQLDVLLMVDYGLFVRSLVVLELTLEPLDVLASFDDGLMS